MHLIVMRKIPQVRDLLELIKKEESNKFTNYVDIRGKSKRMESKTPHWLQ